MKDKAPSGELHALDYQTYAYLQTAQDQAAKKVLEQIPRSEPDPGQRRRRAGPRRGLVRARRIPPATLSSATPGAGREPTPQETRFPWIDAVTYFARALGARRATPRRGQDVEAERSGGDARKDAYWTGQVNSKGAAAWAAFAGEKDEALTKMREAVRWRT
jgi:hypothetical protein